MQPLGELFDRRRERRSVPQQRRDVLEDDARFREVGDVADESLEVDRRLRIGGWLGTHVLSRMGGVVAARVRHLMPVTRRRERYVPARSSMEATDPPYPD